MLYGLKVQISIGENLLIGFAEATACYAAALPQSQAPKIQASEKSNKTEKEMKELEQLDKLFKEEMTKNTSFFNLSRSPVKYQGSLPVQSSFGSSNNDFEQPMTDQKALFRIELDDIKDKDEIYLLLDSASTKKKGIYFCNTEKMPGIGNFSQNLQMFTSVYRCETSLNEMTTAKFNEINDEILQSLQYKFRATPLYCLSSMSFDVSLFDDDHAMIIVTGCCLKFSESELQAVGDRKTGDEVNGRSVSEVNTKLVNEGSYVEVTNLSYVPNAQIEAYFGQVNLFFIRESMMISYDSV